MKTFTDDFKNLFKKVTGLNSIDLDAVVASCETEEDAKKKIAWLVQGGVIATKPEIAKLLAKIDSILDGDASTVDSWEEEVEDNSGVEL